MLSINKAALLSLFAIASLHGSQAELKETAAQKEADKKYFQELRASLNVNYGKFKNWHKKQPVHAVAKLAHFTDTRWRQFKNLTPEQRNAVVQHFGAQRGKTVCLHTGIERQHHDINVEHTATLPLTLYIPTTLLQTPTGKLVRTNAMQLTASQEVVQEVQTRNSLRATLAAERNKALIKLQKMNTKRDTLQQTLQTLTDKDLSKASEQEYDEHSKQLIDTLIQLKDDKSGKFAQAICDMNERHNKLFKEYLLDNDDEDEQPEWPSTPVNYSLAQIARETEPKPEAKSDAKD